MAGITAASASKSLVSGSTSADNTVTDFVALERIVLGTSPTGTAYLWTLSVPSGARATIDDDDASAPSFTPDIEGTYLVTVDVDGTAYVLRITVVQTEVSNQIIVLRVQKVGRAAVATPGSAAAVNVFHSTESALLEVKNSVARYLPIGWIGSVGANLTDADQTVTIAEGALRQIPDGTLTQTRTKTLSTSGAEIGHRWALWKLDAGQTATVTNAGGGGGSWNYSEKVFVEFGFDGTDWAPARRFDLL